MVTTSAAGPRPAVRQRAAGLGDSALRLTPLTTGRDNRSVQGHYRKLLPRRVATLSGSSAKARMSQQFRRALVILRDGLTPALHWARAFAMQQAACR